MLEYYQKFYIMNGLKMNKTLLKYGILLPLILVACKKESPNIDLVVKKDSMSLVRPMDSLSTILSTEKESNQIILSVDASKLPIRLIQEITDPEQQIVLKLENYNHSRLKAYIKPEKPMNVRINQIRMPDNTFDGPFGETIDYETQQKGEYWLIISKNLMASGEAKGRFFIKIE